MNPAISGSVFFLLARATRVDFLKLWDDFRAKVFKSEWKVKVAVFLGDLHPVLPFGESRELMKRH